MLEILKKVIDLVIKIEATSEFQMNPIFKNYLERCTKHSNQLQTFLSVEAFKRWEEQEISNFKREYCYDQFLHHDIITRCLLDQLNEYKEYNKNPTRFDQGEPLIIFIKEAICQDERNFLRYNPHKCACCKYFIEKMKTTNDFNLTMYLVDKTKNELRSLRKESPIFLS
ncbi:MAG: hypothetical protein ACTSVV_11265 [Promethearchaeota archaeon]